MPKYADGEEIKIGDRVKCANFREESTVQSLSVFDEVDCASLQLAPSHFAHIACANLTLVSHKETSA